MLRTRFSLAGVIFLASLALALPVLPASIRVDYAYRVNAAGERVETFDLGAFSSTLEWMPEDGNSAATQNSRIEVIDDTLTVTGAASATADRAGADSVMSVYFSLTAPAPLFMRGRADFDGNPEDAGASIQLINETMGKLVFQIPGTEVPIVTLLEPGSYSFSAGAWAYGDEAFADWDVLLTIGPPSPMADQGSTAALIALAWVSLLSAHRLTASRREEAQLG